MTSFIIAKWDADKHPTSINHKETEAEAKAIVDKIGGFYVESDDYDVPSNYITVDSENKTITVDKSQRDKDIVVLNTKAEIQKLESQETPRRLAEALPDDAGGSAEGRAWLKTNRDKIILERDKL